MRGQYTGIIKKGDLKIPEDFLYYNELKKGVKDSSAGPTMVLVSVPNDIVQNRTIVEITNVFPVYALC